MGKSAAENVKYLQNRNDGCIYRVNFTTRKYALVKTDQDMGITPDIKGGFGKNGFQHDTEGYCHFREVPSPLH